MIDVDRRKNCYSCRRFGHSIKNCRNQGIIEQERKIEYRDNVNNRDNHNLNEKENLIVLN